MDPKRLKREKEMNSETDFQHLFFTKTFKNEFDDNYTFGSFTVNQLYIIYWNNRQVFYSKLTDYKKSWRKLKWNDYSYTGAMHKINFMVDP